MSEWVVEIPFDFMGGAHGTSFAAEGILMNPVGKIEGPVTVLEELDPAADLQKGGRTGEILALVNTGFGGDELGLPCDADEAGAKGFEDILVCFRGGETKEARGDNLSEGPSCAA